MNIHHSIWILLGRPFLTTTRAVINHKNGRLAFSVDNEVMQFKLKNLMKGPTMKYSCMLAYMQVNGWFLNNCCESTFNLLVVDLLYIFFLCFSVSGKCNLPVIYLYYFRKHKLASEVAFLHNWVSSISALRIRKPHYLA